MPQSDKKQQLSPFAEARAQANFLMDIAFSQKAPNSDAIRIGRRKMRVDEVRAELNAARARVESWFAQPTMGADAIRRRISGAAQQSAELPFNVMAGGRR